MSPHCLETPNVSLPDPITTPSWQQEIADSFSRPDELLTFLHIPESEFPGPIDSASSFPFKVTRSYARKMRQGDSSDPLLQQVMPLTQENNRTAGYVADPVGDMKAAMLPGLIHKYRGRVLLVTTGACAIHCRYCFRREFPYGGQQMTRQRENEVMAYIRADSTVSEVILSGGDPLVSSDQRLRDLLHELGSIEHIKRIRIHSRLPVVLPSRITDGLTQSLMDTDTKAVLVIHVNHPNELGSDVRAALSALNKAGITLLNQSVLLRRVNDDAATLCRLSEALFENDVLPYYLHLLDKANGTHHFDVPHAEAQALHEAMRRQLPGYLVPRLVREDAGQPYKSLIGLTAE